MLSVGLWTFPGSAYENTGMQPARALLRKGWDARVARLIILLAYVALHLKTERIKLHQVEL